MSNRYHAIHMLRNLSRKCPWYKSLCGQFEIAKKHRYGRFFVQDELERNTTKDIEKVTCKSCLFSLGITIIR